MIAQRLDLLRLPVLGAFLRWRYARLVLQTPLFLLAALAVFDGLTGRQNANLNVAGQAVWIHYRGLVALVLAFLGNLFCAACPLMLTRGPSKLLKRLLPQFTWPPAWRGKHLVLTLTLFYLYAYEQFDLWKSPWLTAWLILVYFLAALLLDTFFPAGTFCKYVCPLGQFNFALSSASPTQIMARDPQVCESCAGKYCLNGRLETATERSPLIGKRSEHVLIELPMVDASAQGSFPGCETQLFVPSISSNQDCTLCLNCLRACPHDNVALGLRNPASEAASVRPHSDWAWFVVVLAWAGLMNAFAMIKAYEQLAEWLAVVLNTRNEAFLLALIDLGFVGTGVLLTWLAARASNSLSANIKGHSGLRDWVFVMLPVTLAAWGGHYLYHFLTGYALLWPASINALRNLGLPFPEPALPAASRVDSTFYYQVALTYLGFGLSVWAAWKRASKSNLLALLPQVLLVLVYVAITLLIFAQPMQARGSLLMGT